MSDLPRLAEQRLQALEREVALRERVQNFMPRQLCIDVIPQPVYVKDAHSRFVMVNEAVCKNRKKSASELIGRDPFELGADADFARMVVEEDRTVINGASVFKEEQLHPKPVLRRGAATASFPKGAVSMLKANWCW